jgi:DNA-binding SARP family transcriptional activator
MHGQSVLPRAAKPRQVFALLALNAGRIVRVSTLVDELWGGHQPRGYMTTLQTYVYQLRQCLASALGGDSGRSAKDVLATRYDGYLLDVPSGETDVAEFRRLTRSGCAAFDAGDDHEASLLLDRALALWRGRALADLPVGCVLEPEVVSLEDTRLGALERRVETYLRLGRHTELLGELGKLVAQNPTHEGLRAHFMTALYRAGHTARALSEFQRLRNVLVAESGIEPSPRLQRLQGAILMGDPALELIDGRSAAV